MLTTFEAIVAMDENNGIAKQGQIPWKSKTDMKFFKDKTINNIVVMGFNTLLSLPNGCPLKERLNIVVTRKLKQDFINDHCEKYKNIMFMNEQQLLKFVKNPDLYLTKDDKQLFNLNTNYKIYLIGGEQIYKSFCQFCSTIWISKIKSKYNCDLIFSYDVSNYDKTIEYDDDELVIFKATPPNLIQPSF
jgi:dihydrofolate reductase